MAVIAAPVAATGAARANWIALLAATVLFPLAMLSSLPIAFGISMTDFDSDDSSTLLANWWLLVLASVVVADFLGLGVAWTLRGLRRFWVASLLAAVTSVCISAFLLLVLASAFVTG